MIADDLMPDILWQIHYGPGKSHVCNGVVDPWKCCPVAHGAPDSECVCMEIGRHLKAIYAVERKGNYIDNYRGDKP